MPKSTPDVSVAYFDMPGVRAGEGVGMVVTTASDAQYEKWLRIVSGEDDAKPFHGSKSARTVVHLWREDRRRPGEVAAELPKKLVRAIDAL